MTKIMYLVLQRFGLNESTGKQYVTRIMFLDDREKAYRLARFLNEGKYFESPVTVEETKEKSE